jgi:hypothetical protein
MIIYTTYTGRRQNDFNVYAYLSGRAPCLAQWQSQYQPQGVIAPASVSGDAEEGGRGGVLEFFDLSDKDEEQTAEIDVERWIAECWVERVVKAEPGAAVGGGAAARPAVVVKAEPAVAVEAVESME